jgi:hypothetical protein
MSPGLRAIALLVALLVVASGCGGTGAGDPSGIPDDVMLTAEDFGAAASEGRPDAVHPLPPDPCGAAPSPSTSDDPLGSSTSDGPRAERWIAATDGTHRAFEYVARYRDEDAARAFDRLIADLGRCANTGSTDGTGPENRHRIVARYDAGALVERDYDGGTSSYFVGHARDYLVAVLDVGVRVRSGDTTYVNGLGMRALERAGGSAGDMQPAAEPPPAWTDYSAEVTGVRRGPTDRVALIDITVPAGRPDCARDPRITYYTEENNRIYANVVVSSAGAAVVGGCPERAPAVVTLTAPNPLGDRLLVLNQEAWKPDGAGYRKCDGALGCDPPSDPCDPRLLNAVRDGMDVPRNSAYTVEHCEPRWLVMSVNLNSTACGAGGRPGCSAPPSVRRYFLRYDGRWTVVVSTVGPGCADVLASEPAFPRQACANLPAPR